MKNNVFMLAILLHIFMMGTAIFLGDIQSLLFYMVGILVGLFLYTSTIEEVTHKQYFFTLDKRWQRRKIRPIIKNNRYQCPHCNKEMGKSSWYTHSCGGK